jgi:hypothetical protein
LLHLGYVCALHFVEQSADATSNLGLSAVSSMLIDTRSSAIMRGMKLQFSLATLLVCVTVLAVVCAMKPIVVVEDKPISAVAEPTQRPPFPSEIAGRMAAWRPLSIAITLGGLWIIRRLKSRRHTDPPVG